MIKKRSWLYASSSNPDVQYETIHWSDGSITCNCPGWTRRVKKDDSGGGRYRECKHTIRTGVYLGTAGRARTPVAATLPPREITPDMPPFDPSIVITTAGSGTVYAKPEGRDYWEQIGKTKPKQKEKPRTEEPKKRKFNWEE